MKKCQTCGNQNADDMRFCLNCGSSLPDAPVVVNFGGGTSQSGQSNPGTNPYGKSMETQFGGKPAFQQPQQNFSMQPQQSKGGGGSKKIMIAVAGVVGLLLLVLVAVGGIIGYNYLKEKDVKPTPTSSPSASPTASSSPSPSPSKSPSPKTTESPKSSSLDNVKVKFGKVWVDYNITEDGELGMRIHLKFDVTNLKDTDSYAIVYFQKSDGSFLENGSGDYRAKNGRVAAIKGLKPGFDTTVYEDLEIFMPYNKLNLSQGKYNLKMDIDLADGDENLIEHLTFNPFEYEKK